MIYETVIGLSRGRCRDSGTVSGLSRGGGGTVSGTVSGLSRGGVGTGGLSVD